ncbi:hypothetical protein A9Q87_12530 [Flavobacteriales bacterium 34_180_T64]|nr:hypothetical protein A9Q87_12530 [Flavobacteriales bacterium 34_180_T64]
METHYNLNDIDFTQQFKQATLKPDLFTHEAHLRLAWVYIITYGIDIAIAHVCDQLINYVSHLDARDKYNKTVTVAAVKSVYHFMLKSSSDNFKDFIEEFPQLKTNFKGLLVQHYDIDVFKSEVAKSTFIEPNLLPFD